MKASNFQDKRMNAVTNNQTTEERLFYNQKELAKMCGVSRQTFALWVRDGEAPQPIVLGGRPRWIAADIQVWLKKLKRSSVSY
jgi:predicted DNA-binding transcriptional regulator AlpA